MHRARGITVAALIMLATVGCEGTDVAVEEPAPTPSYSGPAWDAYQAGHEFGSDNKDTARIPAEVAEPSGPNDTFEDAIRVDAINARWWCRHHLPATLEILHESEEEALTAGCVGGAYPPADIPGPYVEEVPSDEEELQ